MNILDPPPRPRRFKSVILKKTVTRYRVAYFVI